MDQGGKPGRAKLFIGLLIVVAILGGLYWYYEGSGRTYAFAQSVNACNGSPIIERFSCYRKALETFSTKDLKSYIAMIESNDSISFKNQDSGYAVFGTNCHTFYHAVGDYIAEHSEGEDLKTRAGYCPTACTSGCVMGLYKRVAIDARYSNEVLASMYPSCPQGSENQCSHEVGHVLHDKYVTSVLSVIDKISLEKYGLVQPKPYVYTVSSTTDLNAPFDDCRTLVPADGLAYCDTGVGHNLFLFSEFNSGGDFAATAKECETVAPENQDACYKFLVYRVGINNAAPKYIDNDPSAGTKVCTDIVAAIGRPELATDCYLGLGGGIGLFVDSEYATVKLDEKNFPEVRKNVTEAIYLCEDAPEANRDECYRGLLGTPLKKLYKALNLKEDVIEKILPSIDSAFEVVG